jgi:hypothetical protein
MLGQRLAIASRQSFAAKAVLYLKFFSKTVGLQKTVASLIQSRIDSGGINPIPGDLKRVLSRAVSNSAK